MQPDHTESQVHVSYPARPSLCLDYVFGAYSCLSLSSQERDSALRKIAALFFFVFRRPGSQPGVRTFLLRVPQPCRTVSRLLLLSLCFLLFLRCVDQNGSPELRRGGLTTFDLLAPCDIYLMHILSAVPLQPGLGLTLSFLITTAAQISSFFDTTENNSQRFVKEKSVELKACSTAMQCMTACT